MLYPEAGKKKNIFFAGRSGVGKTTMACIAAVKIANAGYRTLLITTSAHIRNVLDRPVGDKITSIESMANLWAVKIDSSKTVKEYKNKIVTNAKRKYSVSTVMDIVKKLNSSYIEEIATFQKITECASAADFDVIVIDMAPTAQTLRLLEFPMDWENQLVLLLTLPDRTLVKFIVRKFISYCLTERFRASNMQ